MITVGPLDMIIPNPGFIRPADPAAIKANPSRARIELGWKPSVGLDPFLLEMLK